MDLRFGDHPSFHRAAAGMVGASAALGLGLHAVTHTGTQASSVAPIAPIAAGLAGIAIGTAFAHGKAAWRIGAAAVACVPLFVMAPSWPMLAAIAAVMALAIGLAGRGTDTFDGRAYSLRGARGALSVMLGAATVLLAMWAALRIGFARETAAWPSWARDMTSAGAMGMIGVLAMLPRHVRMSLDPVGAAVRRLPAELDGEVRELCNRSLAIWTNAKEKLADADPGKQLVRDGVLKTLEVAAKSSGLDPAGTSEQDLAKRMANLDERIAAATDAEVKTQYQAARAALDDQRRYRDHIRDSRERLIARMHNHVAALEKFQLAASGLVAARAATAGATAVKQLEELSHDVAASGEALAELELGGVSESGASAADVPENAAAATPTAV
jgi:hypothetical protein